MHDAPPVGVGEGGGHLPGHLDDFGDGQWMVSVVLQELAEVAALKQFHHEEQRSVGLAEVVDDGHSPVLEAGGDARLPPEPLAEHTGDGLVLPGVDGFEALDRDLSVQ